MAPNGYKPYVFQGSAVGLALRCKDFQNYPQSFGGSASLPPTGGRVESQSGRHMVEVPGKGTILTYGKLTARVTGDYVNGEDGHVKITAEAAVSDLEILNRVHVQQLENQFVYDHTGNNDDLAEFSLAKPPIVTIMVDKQPLTVTFEAEPKLTQILNTTFVRPNPYKPTVTTIVKQLQLGNQPPIAGNTLEIKDFGTLFFGELIIAEPNDRTLSLVRFESTDYGGSGTGGSTRPGPGQTT
jgi:hypothetical protein